MFNLIKKLFGSEEQPSRESEGSYITPPNVLPPPSPISLSSNSELLKWPSPIAQKVLDDLDKCPAWEWYNCYSHWSNWDGAHYEYRQHLYLDYQLDNWFSIQGLELNSKDSYFIRVKFLTQLSNYKKSLKLVGAKENLSKLGLDYEAVKPWLTEYH